MSKRMALGLTGACVLALAALVHFRATRNVPEAGATAPEPRGEKVKNPDPSSSTEVAKKGADASSQDVVPVAAAQEVAGKQPEDVYAGVPAEKVASLKRAESLLDPQTDNEGAATKGGRDAREVLAEKAARAKAVIQLSQYRLNLTPEAGAQLLRLTRRVPRFTPSGSYSRHRNDRTAALSEEWAALLNEAEHLLRQKIRGAEPFDATAAKKIQALCDTDYRPNAEARGAEAFPDVETAILRGTLAGTDLLPFLFYLDDCAKQIAWHRTRDREASALLKLFSNEERFLILNGLDGRGQSGTKTVGRRYVRVDRNEMDEEYDFSTKANKAVDGILGDLKPSFFTDSPFWKDFSAKYLDVVLELEAARQQRLVNLFTSADADALESLRAAHVLHDELASFVEAAIPNSGYRIRRLAALDKDGRVREKPIPPVDFKPIDPKRYVLKVEDVHEFFGNRGKEFYISFRHTLDDPRPFSASEQVRPEEPADRIKFDLVSKAGATWTYKDATGAKYITRIDKSHSDTPVKGATTVTCITTGPRGTKDVTVESITTASGVYASKINGLAVSPPMLTFSFSASKTAWSVDSKIGDSDRITLKMTSERKRMTIFGEERDVIVTTATGTISGKAFTSEAVHCSGLGTLRESSVVDGKAESRELIHIDRK